MNIRLLVLSFFSSLTIQLCYSQHLVLDEIMKGNDFIGHQPDNIQWSPDSKSFYFSWGKNENNKTVWYEYNLASKAYTKIGETKTAEFPIYGLMTDDLNNHYYFKNGVNLYRHSNDKTELVFSFHKQYRIIKILTSGSVLMNIENQIIEFNPSSGTFIQLLKTTKPIADDEDTFLTKQQDELFEIIKKRNKEKVLREGSALPEMELSANLDWIEIDNNKKFALYEETEYAKNPSTEYISYVTENGEAIVKKARTKVGRINPSHKLFLLDLNSNILNKIDVSGLSGISDAPDYLKYYPDTEQKGKQKEVVYHNHGANPSGTNFLIEIKSYDNKDRWICLVENDGSLTELDHQRDTAWIGGPGISGWTSVGGNAGWINESTVYFQSEESGFSHLYTYDINKKKRTQLTEGKFEVHETTLSKDGTKFYISANYNHPGNREFYSLDIKTKRLKGILTLAGNHQVSISPDEQQLAVRYSYINKPWEIYQAPLEENTKWEQITKSTSEAFNSYNWREASVLNFEASDKKNVHARLYVPEDSVKNGAAVIFVHGAGYLQNAHNWWSGYYREYMFNNLLADLGYYVIDLDYRASKGYGRDWRTAIYRHMGGADLSDHLDARKFLIDTYQIDPNRVGIYGGSYGGFITLMALLTEPGKFKCGAALRSVTDWAHYNHPYTSNILNTPEQDPIAFQRSSPIYFAENLQDQLLMLHGMEDGNVQYQDVVRLSQRFIELGKKDWDLIGYPIEPHGFKETSSWTDEYRRILELFESELR